MSRVLWLPDYAAEEGLRVVEIPGWEKRGLEGLRPRCIVCHHVGLAAGGVAPGLQVCIHGRAGLRNALCNGHLARNGVVSIVASGVAWHAGKGGYRGLTGNSRALGIEAEGTTGEAMPAVERDAYERLVAAWLRGLDREEGWVCSHHHWRAEKPDAWALLHPTGAWERFVAAVGRRLADDVEEWLMALTDREQRELLDQTRANTQAISELAGLVGRFAPHIFDVPTNFSTGDHPQGGMMGEVRRALRRIQAKVGVAPEDIEGADPDAGV